MAEEKSDEEKSKDTFFKKLAELSEEMIAAHGKDFSMGALVLAARFIADGKSFSNPSQRQPESQ